MEIQRRFTSAGVGIAPPTITRDKGGGRIVRGYAAMFDKPTMIGGQFMEIIRPGAFDDVLEQRQDTRALYNHDANMLLGRVSAGTLRMDADKIGLKYIIELPGTSLAADLVEHLKLGNIRGSSFSFSLPPDGKGESWVKGDPPICRVTKVAKLYDVGPVTFPAYESTTAEVSGAKDGKSAGQCIGYVARAVEVEQELADFDRRHHANRN